MTGTSFIPYNLRAAYALPTPEHHEGVYAYYFYRLLQRARRVRMLYCAHADDKTTGEQSRYIYQLDYESGFPVRKVEVGVDVNLAETDPIEVAKDEGVMQRLGTLHRPRIEGHALADGVFPVRGLPAALLFPLRGPVRSRRRDFGGGRRADVRHDPSRRRAETLRPDRGRGAPRPDPAGDDPHG